MWGFLLGFVCAAAGAWILVQYLRQNSRLLGEDLQRVEQEKTVVLEFLHNLVEEVNDENPRRGLHRRIIHAAVIGTGAVSGCLYVRSGDRRLRAAAVEGLFPKQKKEGEVEEEITTRTQFLERNLAVEEIGFGEGIIGKVAETGEPVLLNEEDVLADRLSVDDPAFRIRSFLAVPMFFRKRFLGVIAVANASDGFGFSETDFSLVVSLGEQAGLAIHNADQIEMQMEKQRLDLDLSLAANVQGMLLPAKFPRMPGMDMAAAYETAQRVGGDLYNVLQLPDGSVGVGIADVSGKGVAASLLMSICQTSLSLLAREGASPKGVLCRMNREIIEQIRADMFVTMIYAVIEPNTGIVRMARAGHELPILCHPGGAGRDSCREIRSEGMALGMVGPEIFDSVIEEVEFSMGEGDLLALYTDGVTERVDGNGAEFGSARLMKALSCDADWSAERIKDSILLELDRFSAEDSAADDMTLLLVKSVAKGAKAD